MTTQSHTRWPRVHETQISHCTPLGGRISLLSATSAPRARKRGWFLDGYRVPRLTISSLLPRSEKNSLQTSGEHQKNDIMATSEDQPAAMRESGEERQPPGEKMGVGQHILDKGSSMLQSLKPVKQVSQHACSFALYGDDLSRQIETHHYISRLNQDFLQCAVYDSDTADAHLIG